MTILRLLLASLTWAAYQIITNPFVLAALLCLPYLVSALPGWATLPFFWVIWEGHWVAAAGLMGAYTAGCVGAVLTSHLGPSPLTGRYIVNPRVGSLFWFFGNDQDGLWVDWHRAKYSTRWRWLAPFMWTWWRNKLRNLPFVPGLRWLHRPKGALVTTEKTLGKLLLRVRKRGWMTELEYVYGLRYGDFGPRLDQPDEWGAVSWAFRPFGKD